MNKPDNDARPDFGPTGARELSRTLRCPRCRREFSTARRFLLTCTECGHSWQEESVLSTGERLGNVAGTVLDKVTMPLMWLGVAFAFALFFAPVLYLLIYFTDADAGLIVALVVVLFLLAGAGFSWGGTTAWDTWVRHNQTAASKSRQNSDDPRKGN